MSPDQMFAEDAGTMFEPLDDVTARRLNEQLFVRYEALSRDPNARAEIEAENARFDAAVEAYEWGVAAENGGDYTSAAAEYERAADIAFDDSTVRLARCLTKIGEYARALEWCAVAESEGFEEAADLAALCAAKLDKPAPERPLPIPSALAEPEPEREPASGPRRAHGDGADPGLTRRLKALACTAPLHELDHRKAMLDWLDPAVYQMAEVGLRTIDLVTIAMDFDRGASHDEIIGQMVPFVASQAPGRTIREHERVATWVLERLINVGTVDRSFYQVYGEIDAEGRYHRQPFHFKILSEVPGPRGSHLLRASNEAITVLIGALDTDVESAQVAAEVKLENLINRGKLADARSAAEQARYRTVQYGETLRRRLEATQRDVLLVDWAEELPTMLNDALRHVEDRLIAEHRIQATVTEARDNTDEPERKRHAAELVAVVEDCLRRHIQLQARLQSARSVFRTEQDRQQFAGPPRRAAINLHGQLLEPILQVSVEAAVGPLTTFFRIGAGLTAPEVTTLSSLATTLLRPAVEARRTAGPVVRPNPDAILDDPRFTEEHWRRADQLLHLPDLVKSLGDLVAEAAQHDEELPVLVALRVEHALAPAIESARDKKVPTVLVAVPTGSTFSGLDGALRGDDLLVTAAEIIDVEDEADSYLDEESA